MDATLARLLRVAAEEATRPGFAPFHYLILPGLLRLEGRLAGLTDDEAPELMAKAVSPGRKAPGAPSHKGLLRERAHLMALRKEAEGLGSRVSAFAFEHAQGGVGPDGGNASEARAATACVALCDAHLKSLSSRLDHAFEEFARRAEQERGSEPALEEPPRLRAEREPSSPPRSRFGASAASSLRSGGRLGRSVADTRPSASEQMRKRDEKKKRREERKTLFESFDAGRGAGGGADPVDDADAEAAALVECVLAQAARFKEGSLPWAAKLIGIPVTADRERARGQYRQRARVFHPDVCKHPRGSEAFVFLQRAWEVFESHAEASPS